VLILTRKIGESLLIGDNIRVVVLEVRGKQIRLGIDAPPEIVVLREEVFERLAQENLQATTYTFQDLVEAACLLAPEKVQEGGLRESPPAPDAVPVATRDLGPVAVNEAHIITFVAGIPGFGQCQRFAVIEPPRISPLVLLQSLDGPEVALVTADPYKMIPGYQLNSLSGVLRELKAENHSDLKVLVLLTIPSGHPEEATANLASPILINPGQRLGKQVVIENPRYSARYSLIPSPGNPKCANAD
jgi:flagellar assembly factor FliW